MATVHVKAQRPQCVVHQTDMAWNGHWWCCPEPTSQGPCRRMQSALFVRRHLFSTILRAGGAEFGPDWFTVKGLDAPRVAGDDVARAQPLGS